jgi:hypothetical protein
MTSVDIWAAIVTSIGATAIAMRAFMLRPQLQAWTAASTPVWVSLTALGVGLGMAAVSLWFGHEHASGREAMVETLLAVSGLVLLWNLNRHGRAETVKRQGIANEVHQVMDLSGEPANYPWERRG